MRVLSVLVLVLVAGCDFLAAGSVSAAFQASEREGVAALQVINTGTAAIEYDPLPCGADLEVLQDGEWQPVGRPLLALCEAGPARLGPGAIASSQYPLDVPDGAYRFRLTIRRAGDSGGRDLISNPFSMGDDAP